MKRRYAFIAVGLLFFMLPKPPAAAAVNDCVSGWVTNCMTNASAGLGYYWYPELPPVTGNAYLICPSNPPGLFVTVITNQGWVANTDTNCYTPGMEWNVDPVIVTQWWSLIFTNSMFTNGSGVDFPGSMSTNAGPATLGFNLKGVGQWY